MNQSRGGGGGRDGGIEIKTDIQHLAMICEHMREREYHHIPIGDYCTMLQHASKKFAQLTTNWIRVGYCQGAFVLFFGCLVCFVFWMLIRKFFFSSFFVSCFSRLLIYL